MTPAADFLDASVAGPQPRGRAGVQGQGSGPGGVGDFEGRRGLWDRVKRVRGGAVFRLGRLGGRHRFPAGEDRGQTNGSESQKQ
jgi:hypothetical protein